MKLPERVRESVSEWTSHGQHRKALIFTRDVQTFVSKIADKWSEAELTGKSGDTATVCLLAEYLARLVARMV
jgi:hypothetical protein